MELSATVEQRIGQIPARVELWPEVGDGEGGVTDSRDFPTFHISPEE